VRGEGKPGHRGERKAEVLADLELIHLHAAGIDIGSAENMVCVPARSVGATQSNVRSFGVFTREQDDLVEWLKDCGVTTVAMEATGIYWLTLYDKLESAGLEVLLVDPHSVRHVPGRKLSGPRRNFFRTGGRRSASKNGCLRLFARHACRKRGSGENARPQG